MLPTLHSAIDEQGTSALGEKRLFLTLNSDLLLIKWQNDLLELCHLIRELVLSLIMVYGHCYGLKYFLQWGLCKK